ncbi:MAG: hypothetical protein KJ697_04425 [Nanoarchaeota archaeon]|nr:hypothetical protein [Nanoarchaeota archaeon]
MVKCRWCRGPARRNKFRDVNGIEKSEANCEECFNKSTEELLEEYGE